MLRRAAAVGFEAIAFEHHFHMLHLDDRLALRRLREALRDSTMTLEGMHAPVDRLYGLWWDLSGPTRIRRRTLGVCHGLLDALAYLEGSYLVVHQGKWGFPEEQYGARLEHSLASLEDLARHGQDVGVQVCLENVFGILNRMFLETAAGTVDAGLKFCLDSGHAYVADGDPGGMVDILAGRIATLHLHDNHGTQDEHLIPGDGTIDWVRFIPRLLSAGYRGNLVLEAFPFRYAKGIDPWLRRCLASAEDLRSRA